MSGKTALVIGATSSLAQSICHCLAAQGFNLRLVGRDENELDLLASDLATRHGAESTTMVADFLDAEFSPVTFFKRIGDFTHVIIATGDMGISDPANLSNIAYTIHLNYTIPAQLATMAARHLCEKNPENKKRAGTIVIIASVAGDRGRQSNYAYGSAKAAIATFASGMRNRFCREGVHIMTVKPGFIDTPMTWGMKSPLIASREYVAEKIVKAMHKRKNVVYVPFFWRYIMLIIMHIPETIFKRLSL